MSDSQVKVGIAGTSWWAEAMFLPALVSHPVGAITSIAGRRRTRADEVAAEWGIEHVYDSAEEMIDTADVDAVIIATSNESHYPLAMRAIARGLHVLCEKPLGLTVAQADEMANAADAAQLTTMTPFTYRWMPMVAQVAAEVRNGYIGTPYHLAARYYTGYARDGEYLWRFDLDESGSGVIGDLGTHLIDMATFIFGPIAAVSATTASLVERGPRPDGAEYRRGEDVAFMTVRFESGALGSLTTSAVCWQGGGFNQLQQIDVHGSDGSLLAESDWFAEQSLRGVKAGQAGPLPELQRTPALWDGLRTDTVHNTYRDVFRTTEAQARAWVSAVGAGTSVQPDFAAGAYAQRVADAALRSAAQNGVMTPVATRSEANLG